MLYDTAESSSSRPWGCGNLAQILNNQISAPQILKWISLELDGPNQAQTNKDRP